MRLRSIVPVLLAITLCALPGMAKRDRTPALPPDEDHAKAALDHSPRHGEYVDVPCCGDGGDGTPGVAQETPIRTWVVYPQRSSKAGVVLVIHEIFGLSDWIRGVADELAAEDFIAVAPDLISGLGPNGGGTESVPGRDDVVSLVRKLTPAEAAARIAAVRAWATTIPSANGKIATIGFCWGGGQSFSAATMSPPFDGSVVFYGMAPDSAHIGDVRAPVLAHYGGDDARITATVEGTKATLARLGRSYEPHVYAGAGHGFLRQQNAPGGANLRASEAAWPRTVALLRRELR